MVKKLDPKLIHRKETLIITAIQIIHENGFQGLSTREIARREGISESTIFKHFKSKNELVLAVLEHFSQYDQAMEESILLRDLSPMQRVLHLIDNYLIYYENYPEITAILQSYNNLLHETELRGKVQSISFSRAKAIKSLIDESIKVGEMDSAVNSESLADIILGTIQRIILKWRMKEFDFSLREYTLSSITMILDAFTIKRI
jgi:AcrR family transcriptional regulator